ncbi:MAG: hypothetical protein KBC84_06760 [Proteobacteria bacterium]|nr:hypothetical protein [Pseudomonadota bacterium]
MNKSEIKNSAIVNERLSPERLKNERRSYDENVIKTVYSPEGKVIYQLIRNNKNYYERRINRYSD